MRIVFCGTPEAAVPSLEAIARAREGWELAAVVTQPDRPAGRGGELAESPVKKSSRALDVPVRTPLHLKEIRSELESIRPDVIVVVAFGRIFRPWLLELPRLGCVNLHFSLLPRHRGVAPVAWAILLGDQKTGVATMRMDPGVDTGPVFLRETTAIGPEETTGELTERLARLGAELLARTLALLFAGRAEPIPQEEARATYAPKITKDFGRLDWQRPAEELARRVRAASPWPGAFARFREKLFKIHRARVLPGELAPGSLRLREGRLEAGTAAGILELIEVQIEGKSRLTGEAWYRGARPEGHEHLAAFP